MDNRVPVNSPTSLAARLRRRIEREGALTFRDWMEAALYDARAGYYCRRDRARWGRTGDYRTSAEASPLFAATFAGYFATLYEQQNEPREWTILEAGAGAGHFAHGVLKTFERYYPALFAATRYIIDEASADARARARRRLAPFRRRVEFGRLGGDGHVSIHSGVVFSNELLDALPVHRVTMRDGKLFELCVDLEATGAFRWVLCEPTTARLASYLEDCGTRLREGQIAEINLAAGDWIARAAGALARGYVVTVDYGAEAADLYGAPDRHQGTLRAFTRHRFAGDVLAQPGERDLTATVNWTAIKNAGARAGLQTILYARQDRFLLNAGALDRLHLLTEEAPGTAAAAALRLSARELILPGGMGESFQVLVQRKPATGRSEPA